MVVFVLRKPVGKVAVEQAYVDQCKHPGCLPQVHLSLCGKPSGETVDRSLGEFHPPDGVQRLFNRPNRAVFMAEVFHLVVRRGIGMATQWRRRRRAKLWRPKTERPGKAKSRRSDEAVPGRGGLIRTDLMRERVDARKIPAIACPDSRQIAFDDRSAGQSDVFTILVAGRERKRLTNDPS